MLISRRVIGLTFVAVFTLLATGWIADRSARIMDRALSWVVHTRVVLAAVAECRVGVLRAETVARAYAITGTPEFLREFDGSERYLHDSVAHVKKLTADNAREQALVAGISSLVDSVSISSTPSWMRDSAARRCRRFRRSFSQERW